MTISQCAKRLQFKRHKILKCENWGGMQNPSVSQSSILQRSEKLANFLGVQGDPRFQVSIDGEIGPCFPGPITHQGIYSTSQSNPLCS